jgi:hypothetical protein
MTHTREMKMSDVHGGPDPDPDVPEQQETERRGAQGWSREEKETKEFRTTAPINIKGRDYAAGDTVVLNEEEYGVLSELHAPLEGIEQVPEEEWQSKHEEGVEAQNEAIKKRAEEDEKQLERLKAREQEDAEQEVEDQDAQDRAAGNKRELLAGRGGVQGRVPGESDQDVLRSQGRRPEGPRPPEGISTSTRSEQERQKAFDRERSERRSTERRGAPKRQEF